MSTGRKPNWTLCVKEGEKWVNLGAAWETEKGNLFLKLDEGQVLRGTAMLFPYREKPTGYQRRDPYRHHPAKSMADYMESKRRPHPTPSPTAPPAQPPADDACPDPEAPDWL